MFEDAFESVDRELTFSERVLADAAPQQLAVVLEGMRTSSTARQIEEQMAECGPEGPMAIAVALRPGMSPEDAVLLAKQARDILSKARSPD